MKLRRAALLSSVFLCFSAQPAIARTLVVDNDGAECPQAEYTTIQQAVAAAQAGDKILVCPGLYLGTVVVETPDLRIEAQRGPGEVVLQGTGAVGELGIVLLNTTGVVLQGFTVQRFGRAQIRIQKGGGNTVRKNVARNAVVNDGIQVTSSSANVVKRTLRSVTCKTVFSSGASPTFLSSRPPTISFATTRRSPIGLEYT